MRPIDNGTGEISIHAPRAGSDAAMGDKNETKLYFNPRSPCGERRQPFGAALIEPVFQSTLPVRGATRYVFVLYTVPIISIHAPRAGSDGRLRRESISPCVFQSTLPVRGATAIYCAFASSKRNIYSISYSKHCERYKRQTSFNRIRCESLWNFLRASDSHS